MMLFENFWLCDRLNGPVWRFIGEGVVHAAMANHIPRPSGVTADYNARMLYDTRARHLPQSIDGTFSPIWSSIIEEPDRARALRGFETAVLFELKNALRNGSNWVPHSLSYRNREQLQIPAHRGRRPEELMAISGSLTLLSNITIAWMTLHMQQVTNRWKKEEGRHIDPEILRHIGPARSEGVNFRGKLDFPVGQCQERLLSRKPNNL